MVVGIRTRLAYLPRVPVRMRSKQVVEQHHVRQGKDGEQARKRKRARGSISPASMQLLAPGKEEGRGLKIHRTLSKSKLVDGLPFGCLEKDFRIAKRTCKERKQTSMKSTPAVT
jgi:hypothetical protein